MQEIISAIKDVWATLIALGWQPMPTAVALLMMIVLRSYFEPDVLSVTTIEERTRLGKIKLHVFLSVMAISLLLHVGMAKPSTAYDWCTAIGFCVGHTMAAYVISSSPVMRNFLKNGLMKGGAAQ